MAARQGLSISCTKPSIAVNLVEIADQAASSNAGLAHVTTVHLRLGQLSGVVADALLFGYDITTQGTRLEGSRLEIQEVPVIVFCSQCQTDYPLPDIQLFRCPVCGDFAGFRHRGQGDRARVNRR